ncbi:MAG: hypothetical protein WBD72_01645 [Candidatus Acidiferrum sp.]
MFTGKSIHASIHRMGGLPSYVKCAWALCTLGQLIVLVVLFWKGNYRKVPLFTSYISLNLCQVGLLLAAYSVWGFTSEPIKALAWLSEYITLIAAALATTEILEVTLRPYQGIWGLGWRALAFVSAVVVILVALAARGHWASARWFELDRGYHLTFATAVTACLLIVRYYSIEVPSAYKMILGGFCFYSCVQVLIYTIIQALLHKTFYDFGPIWQFSALLSFTAVQVIWVTALRKPLPVEARVAASLSDSDYQRLSPEINEQLRLLNEKLLRLWKMEASSH